MLKDWSRQELEELVDLFSSKNLIEKNFLKALIETESSWNLFAERAEPTWRYLYNVRDFSDLLNSTYITEQYAQSRSYGLCQIMGSVAREHGFHDWLSKLYCPDLNLKYACMHIKLKASKYGDDPETLYAAYNAGSPVHTKTGMFMNQKNIDRFMTFYRQLAR